MRQSIIKTLKREGYIKIPVDYEMCESQVKAFKDREGHEDYPAFFDQCHRPVELEIQPGFKNGFDLYKREKLPADTTFSPFGVGHSKGSERRSRL